MKNIRICISLNRITIINVCNIIIFYEITMSYYFYFIFFAIIIYQFHMFLILAGDLSLTFHLILHTVTRAVYRLDFVYTNTDILIMTSILNDTNTDTFTTKC